MRIEGTTFGADAQTLDLARRYKRALVERLFGAGALAAAAPGSEGATTAVALRRLPPGSNVVGIGFGVKVAEGASIASTVAIRVYVRAKLPRRELGRAERVPDQFNGLPTDVIAVGEVTAARPVSCGVSIGHPNVGAGTLGCLVKSRNSAGGQRFILSNNHILADCNNATIGDDIIEPGVQDGGVSPIAQLTGFEPLDFSTSGSNVIDAAVAELIQSGDVTPDIKNIGRVATPPVPAALNQSVRKQGRTTQHTRGVVDDIAADIPVGYVNGRTATFENLIAISGVGGVFGLQGDSGALIVDAVTLRPTGLLVAVGGSTTFACHIQPVLDRFAVDIV